MNTASESLGDWLAALAAKRPTPGGGGAAAAAAAIGNAVGAMAVAYTTGKRWADQAAEVATLTARLKQRASALLQLADDDAAAYQALQASWRADDLPDDERQRIEAEARRVPATILQHCAGAAADLAAFTERCNPRIVSDLHCGILLLAGAGRAAATTLAINQPPADEARRAQADLDQLDACEKASRPQLDRPRS